MKYLLLAAALVASASAGRRENRNSPDPKGYRTKMSEASFSHWPSASQYSGAKVSLDFYTAPSADKDLDFMHHLKATVMRLFDDAVEFQPHMVILPGSHNPPGCRLEDNSPLPIGSEDCGRHCSESGRYCDFASFLPHDTSHHRRYHGVSGHSYVEESARCSCIWKNYGANHGHDNMYRYFQYHDAMRGTGCDQTFSDSCLDQVFRSVDYNKGTIDKCMGKLEATGDEANSVLDKEIKSTGDLPKKVPALKINGEEVPDFENMVAVAKTGGTAKSVLKMVCDAMPEDSWHPKPKVCDFCLNWCPQQVGGAFHMDTCVWELDCGDGKTKFDQYMEEWKEEHPYSLAAFTGTAGNAAGGTLRVIATFVAVILAAGLTALAVMAIRVWRTKMIIDRYVKEQQAMNKGGSGGGVHGHRDPSFFPEDNELDLDLEPALQYSDHIQAAPGAPAISPTRANFLPQLT